MLQRVLKYLVVGLRIKWMGHFFFGENTMEVELSRNVSLGS